MKTNYQLALDKTLSVIDTTHKPLLLLQCCCGPCSSYVLDYLTPYFNIAVYNYNPNIHPEDEYYKRLHELERLCREMPREGEITVLDAPYEPEDFFDAVSGLEHEREGGARCAVCFKLRLERSARKAKELGADYFTTTLSVSPHKDSQLLNDIGVAAGEKYGVPFLCSDFKKRDGYKKSIELSAKYGLYRQSYCGCVFSLRETNAAAAEKEREHYDR